MTDLSPLHMPQAKLCLRCQTYKDWDEFGIRRDQKDGKNYWCKACVSTYGANNYVKTRQVRLEQAANHREVHREENRLYQVEYRQKFPDKARKVCRNWRQANAPQRRLIEHNREARKRSLPDTWTTEEQAFMLRYWHNACAVCGNAAGLFWELAFDHWIPLASPHCPGTVATNMLPLCHGNLGCNNSKHKNEPHSWLVRRFDTKKVARIEKAIEVYFHLVRETFTNKGA